LYILAGSTGETWLAWRGHEWMFSPRNAAKQ